MEQGADRVPELERHVGAAVLWHAVRAWWPLFFSFVITFGLTGVFWFWHHAAFHHMRRADGVIIYPKTPFVRRFSIGIRVQAVACGATLVMIPINPQWFVLVQMPMGIIMRRRLRAEKRA